jgi:hypothetical protein
MFTNEIADCFESDDSICRNFDDHGISHQLPICCHGMRGDARTRIQTNKDTFTMSKQERPSKPVSEISLITQIEDSIAIVLRMIFSSRINSWAGFILK